MTDGAQRLSHSASKFAPLSPVTVSETGAGLEGDGHRRAPCATPPAQAVTTGAKGLGGRIVGQLINGLMRMPAGVGHRMRMNERLSPSDIAVQNIATASASPADTGEGLVPSLLSISKSTRAYLALLLVEIDLHPGQDQLIVRLEPGEAVSVSALAELLAVRPSTVSKMLDRLIEKNLVQRASNSADARRTMVSLTPGGEAMKLQIRSIWSKLEGELSASMVADDYQRMMAALQQADGLLATKLRRLR